MEQFRIRTTARPDHVIVHLAGDIDLACAKDLAQALALALTGDRPIVVDCSEVTSLDSAGLCELAEARLMAERSHTTLRLRRISTPVRRVLELSGTEALFTADAHSAGSDPTQQAMTGPRAMAGEHDAS